MTLGQQFRMRIADLEGKRPKLYLTKVTVENNKKMFQQLLDQKEERDKEEAKVDLAKEKKLAQKTNKQGENNKNIPCEPIKKTLERDRLKNAERNDNQEMNFQQNKRPRMEEAEDKK
eukprot:11457195-Heterocapsa_arctica.AAC.1